MRRFSGGCRSLRDLLWAAIALKPARRKERRRADKTTRGRPKLGVVAREVTLLPRQWEWLATQPGGASATLRRLVDDARKAIHPRQRRRAAQEAAYRFMQAIAGDLPGYEEATRALFADDRLAFEERIGPWPEDIRIYAVRLAFGPLPHPDQTPTTEQRRSMSRPEPISWLEPTQEAGRLVVQRDFSGPIVMLDLPKFRNVARCSRTIPSWGRPCRSAVPKPSTAPSGMHARISRGCGGDVLFLGEGGPFLIGPADERWDMSMPIRRASANSCLSVAGHAEYFAGLGHRVAAVAASRLLPLSEMPYTTGTEGTRS